MLLAITQGAGVGLIALAIFLARRPPLFMPEPLPASGDLLSWPPPFDEEETSYA